MTATRPALFGFAVVAAGVAALCTVVLSFWYLSLRFDTLDALWEIPVLLCYPAWLFAALAIVLVYFSHRAWFTRALIISAAELLICAAIWIAVRNFWVIGR
jgi:hypothetical protein